MEAIKQFLTGSTAIAGAAIPNWAFVAAGAVALILLIVIICVAAKAGKKKNDKPAAAPVKAEPPAKEEAKQEPVVEEKPAPVAEEKAEPIVEEKAEPIVEEKAEPAEEKAEPAEEKAEPIVEEKPEPVEEKPEPVEEKPAPAEEKKPAEKKAPAKKAEPKAEKPSPAEEKKAEPEKTGPVVKRNDTESSPAAGRRARMANDNSDAVFGKGVVEEPVVEPAKKEEKAEKKPAEKKAPAKKAEPKAEKEVAATTEPAKKGAIGKFEICNSNIGGFRYLLSANNGQLLYESRDYKTFDGCREAIDKFINAVKAGDFRVRGDKFGNFKFNLKSPTSNNVVFVGESYDAKKKCESAVESVKRFAETAKIVDITEADFVATSAAFDIADDVKAEVNGGKGATGKWEITTEDDMEPAPYVFLLYANNGQLLYESRDYKTFDNCRSGLETFVKTVKDGEFIVDSDKFGRYRFILRKAGNQVEYVGQNYNDKQSAIRSATSVYKFALLTPIEL